MTGYSRKLVSLEIALKEIIKDLKDEGLKKATGKSESHFRKCSAENDFDHNIHHKDSVAIDIESLKRGFGSPMLTAHEDLLEATSSPNGKCPPLTPIYITYANYLTNY